MLIEFLYELKDSINKHGIRWGVVFALYAVFRKERRNYRLDQRDREHNTYFQAILENQVKIMDGMGVEPCADTSTLITQLSAKKQEDGYMSFWMEKLLARYVVLKGTWSFTNWNIRRQSRMLNKAWLVGLIGYLAFFAKQMFGVEVTDDVIDKLADFVLLAVALIPMFINMVKHRRGETASEPTQYTNTFESNK